ncbi:unnamed protein product, partial [Candidula unifasciata]
MQQTRLHWKGFTTVYLCYVWMARSQQVMVTLLTWQLLLFFMGEAVICTQPIGGLIKPY